MRDIFTEIFKGEALDPTQAARLAMRPRLAKRFYRQASVADDGLAVLLDGKPVKTPSRWPGGADAALAEAIAADEWNGQGDVIDPAAMPLTRLANSIIDGVADAPEAVAADIAKYLETDLVCYRAQGPEGLIAQQARLWDPLLDCAREAIGAHFVWPQGIVLRGASPRRRRSQRRAPKAIPDKSFGARRAVGDHDVDRLGADCLAMAKGRLTTEQALGGGARG